MVDIAVLSSRMGGRKKVDYDIEELARLSRDAEKEVGRQLGLLSFSPLSYLEGIRSGERFSLSSELRS